MTGGYYDYRKSKLKFVKTIRENKTVIKKKELELKEIEAELKDILCSVPN
jgi:structural maintenance of chromosome 3 (chondroitin sulfate proteoglycan 6)